MTRTLPAISAALLLCAAFTANAQDKQPPVDAKPSEETDRAALEEALSKKLTGAVLEGSFTVDGREEQKLRSERYSLGKVAKVKDDTWRFEARIQYGETDVKVPIPLTLLWAGDTPMISMTDFTIPGLGTFTARVFFYGDRYAGTWQHGKAGGHLFGKIERRDEKTGEPETADQE